MKIWFAAAIRENDHGGINRSMKCLSRELHKLGHETRILYARTARETGFIVFPFRLMSAFLNTKQRPDFIIARSTDGVLVSVISGILRLKTRIILHNHGWEEKVFEKERTVPREAVNNPTTWKSALVRFPLLRLALRSCACCMSGTIEEARWIRAHYRSSAHKTAVIPNGVDKQETCYWKQKDRPPYFLTAGSFTWKKNLEYAVSVFGHILDEIPDARLYMVGAGNPGNFHDRGYLDRYGKALILIPQEQPERMEKWFMSCPYFFSTSLYEGGRSLALLEAMSYGAVGFASPVPSTLEIIVNRTNGILLETTDPEKDAATVLEAIKDRELVEAVSVNAWRTSLRNGWERQGVRLDRLLKAIAPRKKGELNGGS